jgi:hypothetical protein
MNLIITSLEEYGMQLNALISPICRVGTRASTAERQEESRAHKSAKLRSFSLLLRSSLSAIAAIVIEIPLFSHPYLQRVLAVVLRIYSQSHASALSNEAAAVQAQAQRDMLLRDIDRCLAVLSSSIPPRLSLPILTAGCAEILSISTFSATKFSKFLGSLWSDMDRTVLVQHLPQLTAMAMLLMDYRRAFGDQSISTGEVSHLVNS